MIPQRVEEALLLQGEVSDLPGGLYLQYTTVAKPMKVAMLEESRHVQGAACIEVLRSFLCPRSYEWLRYLLDAYDSHVVEFSSYGLEYGVLPGYNTLFWEVRNY